LEGEITINITAFVLAGGFSRRFGSNKALFPYNGKPLIMYPLQLLSQQTESVHIIAKDTEPYAEMEYPVVVDAYEQQTPLVGILSGLKESRTDWNVFTACDMPFLTTEVFERLQNNVSPQPENDAIVPVADGQLQPLVAFYRRRLIPTLRTAIDENLSMKEWLSDLTVKQVKFQDNTPFQNINSKEDLHAADHR